MRQPRVSPKQLERLGWTRTKKAGDYFASYKHRDGWSLDHCGHPTALWPWMLTSPRGEMILTGAQDSGNPTFGTAWPSVTDAVEFVFSPDAARYAA